MNDEELIAFGPVPSRRLGQSLGINNIPPKSCTYSCIYCQLGRTSNMCVKRQIFYKPKQIQTHVEKKVNEAKRNNEPINFLTFVPDGEPTLDNNLGVEIDLLKPLGFKIAVITNASLLWMKNVRYDLREADWVSVKIDAADSDIWKRTDRPHGSLKLGEILEGIIEFASVFKGKLVTETMLIQGVNDEKENIENIAAFITELKPAKSYLSIPTRPPAEKRVKPATEHTINLAYHIFKEKSIDVEYIIGYEGNTFAFTGDIEEDLLSITSVHPIRKDGMQELLKKACADWTVVEKLIDEDKLLEETYKGRKFYMRKWSNWEKHKFHT